MWWALPSSLPGLHFSVLVSFEVAQKSPSELTVTLTLAELLTAPPVELDSHQSLQFRQHMDRALALLGARPVPHAAHYTFRVDEHRNPDVFAIAFTAGVPDEPRHVIVERRLADELTEVLTTTVSALAAVANAQQCASLRPPPT
jgi:hypothetical protein